MVEIGCWLKDIIEKPKNPKIPAVPQHTQNPSLVWGLALRARVPVHSSSLLYLLEMFQMENKKIDIPIFCKPTLGLHTRALQTFRAHHVVLPSTHTRTSILRGASCKSITFNQHLLYK